MTLYAILGLGRKTPIFSESYLKKNYLFTFKTKFGTPNYILMLHIPKIVIFISDFDQKYIFEQIFTLNAIFTIRVPVKNVFL